MKSFLFLLILGNLPIIVYSQQQREQIKTGIKYQKAIIYLKDYNIKRVKDLVISDKGFASFYEKSGNPSQIPVDQIDLIKVKTGTHVIGGTILGGLTGVISVCLTGAILHDSFFWDIQENNGKMTAWFTLGGATIGAIFGLMSPKWDILKPPQIEDKKSFSSQIISGYNPEYKTIMIGLNINF